MKFTLTIQCDNAAFGECPGDAAQEVAHILRETAKRLDEYDTSGACRDTNGNTVGRFEFSGEPRTHARRA